MAKRSKKVPKKASREVPAKNGEKCLHYRCQQWLEKTGIWSAQLIFHVPNERRGGFGAIMHFKRLGVRPGVADYLTFTKNRNAAIELKDGKGKQRKGQEKFQREWEALGHLYLVVRTLEEFQGTINALILF